MTSEPPHANADLAGFSRSAPLFPLPNGVFYPQILFPLYVFEPRYRKMTADALAGDRLIATALLKPGWELLPRGSVPPIFDTVCLSAITAEEKLPDGRYYLVLQGLSRARVLRETPLDLPYRMAELELCRDVGQDLSESDDRRIREELLRGIQTLHPNLAVNPMFVKALDRDLPMGELTDVLAYALGLTPAEHQRILAELDVARRSRLVLEAIHSEAARQDAFPQHFPPNFSRN